MPKTKQTKPSEIDLTDPQYYVSRELGWLEFNRRVLSEALDPRTALLERLKFTAIFSSNLDEFFMVRVAVLKEQVKAEVSSLTPDGRSPQEQIDAISPILRPMVMAQHQNFETTLRPQLADHGIYLSNYGDLNEGQQLYLQRYFEEQIFPVLTPLAYDPSHPFPLMSNLSLNLVVIVKHPETNVERFARVKVPDILPRFIAFPPELRQHDGKPCLWVGVTLEQAIAHNLESLFPGMMILEHYPFRITRDADLEVEEDEADDLLLAIQQELRRQSFGGSVVRLELQSSTSAPVRKMLLEKMELSESDVYEVEGLLNLKDLMALMSLPLPEQKDQPWTPLVPPRLRPLHEGDGEDIFSIIRRGDVLMHHPYESFSASVERFITEAAHDPKVLAIKMTLYRTSGDSPIVKALIAAAENGKQVAALIELKARFDEANNINWARKLEQAGVHVVYGFIELKTHTKVVLVVRREDGATPQEMQIQRYVHIGTGNYNPKTASLYTDLGLLSCREDLGADLTDLFNYLTGFSRQRSYRKILVAPVNLRDRMASLIQREAEHCKNGRPGRIIAKMNALVDPGIIRALYAASQVGVQIDVIVRGICCLRPGVKGVSENLRVISVIGRFLEHSRIFYFGNDSQNGGQEEIYIGSADWMTRNLDRRVEAVTPVEDADLIAQLKQILDLLLNDNRQAWDMQPDGSYVQRHPRANEPERSAQKLLMEKALKASTTI